jgi:hypothetical protein
MPMTFFERKVLRVATNFLFALFTCIREFGFVAGKAVWFVITKNVSLTSQRSITTTTSEMTGMVFLIHGTSVFF